HESPLPPARGAVDITYREGQFHYQLSEAGRRSFLPVPLMLEVDFWINLPAYTDHPVLGINGALVNATLWNASNTARFFGSQASGRAAVAEMAAIPALAERWVFSIVSLERYQFLGGPDVNSLYTESEPMLWLSADPVALDSRMYQKINDSRRDRGFPEIDAWMTLLDYAMKLNLGRP